MYHEVSEKFRGVVGEAEFSSHCYALGILTQE